MTHIAQKWQRYDDLYSHPENPTNATVECASQFRSQCFLRIYIRACKPFIDCLNSNDDKQKENAGHLHRTGIPGRFKRPGICVRPVGRAYLEGSTPQAVFSATSLPLRPHKTNVETFFNTIAFPTAYASFSICTAASQNGS